MSEVDESMPKSRGWRRMQELNRASEADRQQLEASLLAGLGRNAAAVDIIAIEALASATVNARRKRAAGRNDSAELKLVAQLLRATGLKPSPAAAPTEQNVDPFGLLLDDDNEAIA